ncbi:MAG: hypothetical protein ACJ739_07645 [Acidimicrobiales bacterium]
MFRKLAAVAAVLLVTTACAKEAESGLRLRTGDAAVSALHRAPDAAIDAGTARFEMALQMGDEGDPTELVATGVFDKAAGQGAFSMDMAPLLQQLGAGDGESLPFDLDDATLEMVIDGDTLYLRSPLFGLFTDADRWLSASAQELGAAGGFGVGSTDPTTLLEALRGVGRDPEVVGQEEVRGVPTTHYRAAMSLADALAEVPEAQRAEAEAAFEQLGDLDTAEVPVDVWVDGDDLPRRVRMDMGAVLAGLAGGPGRATMTLELFDYGQPVEIQVPTPDDVRPAAEVLPDVGGMLGS